MFSVEIDALLADFIGVPDAVLLGVRNGARLLSFVGVAREGTRGTDAGEPSRPLSLELGVPTRPEALRGVDAGFGRMLSRWAYKRL